MRRPTGKKQARNKKQQTVNECAVVSNFKFVKDKKVSKKERIKNRVKEEIDKRRKIEELAKKNDIKAINRVNKEAAYKCAMKKSSGGKGMENLKKLKKDLKKMKK